ncbi:RNA polymerase sigma factor [Xanthobacter agilis]|uniref:RNA polymerase sigma-70 factor (ECF subfamily) n=1 Tax=Xanthobacter agilis TaxID=47492 RepID=A0ABU0LHG2_XANAG|nr:sigma-70 family RNA polymerase sigma factor [Xanthobacter agilis]MDQ0506522.1 RNA polymerase sigma-70 factor (ECF subfamily) [Xanthobacter agilis]
MARDADARIEAQIPGLRRYAFALVRDRDRADDLVQDCLERALSHARRPVDEEDLRAWLFTILRNLHISAWRSARRRGETAPLDAETDPGQPADQERALVARDALGALDQLPEEQQSLLLLIAVEDLSYDGAARVLGIPVGTVMSRLSRARRRLRALMDREHAPLLRRVK